MEYEIRLKKSIFKIINILWLFYFMINIIFWKILNKLYNFVYPGHGWGLLSYSRFETSKILAYEPFLYTTIQRINLPTWLTEVCSCIMAIM